MILKGKSSPDPLADATAGTEPIKAAVNSITTVGFIRFLPYHLVKPINCVSGSRPLTTIRMA